MPIHLFCPSKIVFHFLAVLTFAYSLDVKNFSLLMSMFIQNSFYWIPNFWTYCPDNLESLRSPFATTPAEALSGLLRAHVESNYIPEF